MNKELIIKVVAATLIIVVLGVLVAMGKMDKDVLIAVLALFLPSPLSTKVVLSRDSVEKVQ